MIVDCACVCVVCVRKSSVVHKLLSAPEVANSLKMTHIFVSVLCRLWTSSCELCVRVRGMRALHLRCDTVTCPLDFVVFT